MRCKLRMKIKDAKMEWQRNEPTEDEEDEIRDEDEPRCTRSNAQVEAETVVCRLCGPGTVGFEGNLLPKDFTEAVSVVFSLYYLYR